MEVISAEKDDNLTTREQEIMELLLEGMALKEISGALKISLKTVDFHRDNLYRKLGIQSQKELFTKYLPKKQHKLQLSAENPLIMILGYDGGWGWQSKYYAVPPFFNEKINAGDRFVVNCTYKSNVFIDLLQVALVDNMVEADNWWTELCGFLAIRRDIQPNTEYSDSLTMFAAKSASSTHINSNVFVFNAYRGTKEQPTLTFTKLEIIQA